MVFMLGLNLLRNNFMASQKHFRYICEALPLENGLSLELLVLKSFDLSTTLIAVSPLLLLEPIRPSSRTPRPPPPIYNINDDNTE